MTRREHNNIIIEWVAPDSNGSPITSYTVLIGKADLTFAVDLDNCDGSSSSVILSESCTIS